MLRRSIVGENAFRVADCFADRLVGKVALGPDPAHQTLRHLAGVDVEVVHQLGLLGKLLHDLRALGADSVDREAEGEPDRVVGHRLHHRHDLAGIDEAEGPGEDIDAAAAGACAR